MGDASFAYTIVNQTPTVETYRRLRVAAGLSPKTVEASERGLPNTLFAVQLLIGDETVGMGRVVGDGGTFFQVVDIAVLPKYQGRGLGKVIMAEIAGFIAREVPESGYVSLLADGQAYRLYQQYGFEMTAPASVGMGFKKVASDGA
ncbi:MAG: N-acetyltransferase [Rhodanobacter sp.]|nr:MAG: N-acetyltransferase [Rhodanobacter sp.]TAM13151.1 MAG: N-acetyltransferase [Rhodanobacter sp.]TAM35152.1 MAG: N-acetyltransferase [Rhodanobacter sp.]